jgi:hypothetical protein
MRLVEHDGLGHALELEAASLREREAIEPHGVDD